MDGTWSAPSGLIETALREEREFVLALGGFALEIPGAVLVTNERIPVPRFNFVQDIRVSRDRLAGFFERTLDHYFQRALRPIMQVGRPVPGFLSEHLQRFGFRPLPEDRYLLQAPPRLRGDTRGASVHVRPARESELDTVAQFWMGERERAEFRRSLDVITEHPNPEERGIPFLADRDGDPVATGFLYRHGPVGGIHGVATQPQARGLGAATAVVTHMLEHPAVQSAEMVVIWSESARLTRHLERLGFRALARYQQFELPKEVRLELPPAAPPAPPRWRPPRGPGTSPAAG